MILKGTVKGKTIQLEESLPYPDGQDILIDIWTEQALSGSPSLLRQVMHESPHLQQSYVDALEKEIEGAKLSVTQHGAFDEER